jgi:hypothetical protein
MKLKGIRLIWGLKDAQMFVRQLLLVEEIYREALQHELKTQTNIDLDID